MNANDFVVDDRVRVTTPYSGNSKRTSIVVKVEANRVHLKDGGSFQEGTTLDWLEFLPAAISDVQVGDYVYTTGACQGAAAAVVCVKAVNAHDILLEDGRLLGQFSFDHGYVRLLDSSALPKPAPKVDTVDAIRTRMKDNLSFTSKDLDALYAKAALAETQAQEIEKLRAQIRQIVEDLKAMAARLDGKLPMKGV